MGIVIFFYLKKMIRVMSNCGVVFLMGNLIMFY